MRPKAAAAKPRVSRAGDAFLHGVALALNAVADITLRCEGLAEFLPKAERLIKRHDLGSTLGGPRGGPGSTSRRTVQEASRTDTARRLMPSPAASISRMRASEGSVAVVGYMMERNEGDHRGNVGELERMLHALGSSPLPCGFPGGLLSTCFRPGARARSCPCLTTARRATSSRNVSA